MITIPNIEQVKVEFDRACQEIPEKYRDIVPSKLQASKLSRLPAEEQTKLYAEINSKPLEGWAFFAPAGYSKSTCSWALYKYALRENLVRASLTGNEEHIYREPGVRQIRYYTPCYVWHISVPEWLEQIQRTYSDPKAQLPRLDSSKIAKARRDGFTPRVFLEEIDKVKEGSEWVTNKLFNLINEIDAHKGQLVIDSNLSRQQFMLKFGEPFYRRIKENCNMREFGF
jgi:hypothetical protein